MRDVGDDRIVAPGQLWLWKPISAYSAAKYGELVLILHRHRDDRSIFREIANVWVCLSTNYDDGGAPRFRKRIFSYDDALCCDAPGWVRIA